MWFNCPSASPMSREAKRPDPGLPPLVSEIPINNGQQVAVIQAKQDGDGITLSRRVKGAWVIDQWRDSGKISASEWHSCERFAGLYRAAGLTGYFAHSRFEARIDGAALPQALEAAERTTNAKAVVERTLLNIGEYSRSAAALVIGERYSIREFRGWLKQSTGTALTVSEVSGVTLAAVSAVHAQLSSTSSNLPVRMQADPANHEAAPEAFWRRLDGQQRN